MITKNIIEDTLAAYKKAVEYCKTNDTNPIQVYLKDKILHKGICYYWRYFLDHVRYHSVSKLLTIYYNELIDKSILHLEHEDIQLAPYPQYCSNTEDIIKCLQARIHFLEWLNNNYENNNSIKDIIGILPDSIVTLKEN